MGQPRKEGRKKENAQHSRVPLVWSMGPTASNLMMSIFPCSIEMCISSPMAGLARKNRVGTTERSPYFSTKPMNSSNTLGLRRRVV